jgi:hypothetical protein
MYVLSSMPPNRQSIAGSLFQTLTRLCTAVGYGIATAIFNGVRNKPANSGYYAHNPVEPYAATWWFAVGTAAIGVLFIPWLRIQTQGHAGDKGRVAKQPSGDANVKAVNDGDVEKGDIMNDQLQMDKSADKEKL